MESTPSPVRLQTVDSLSESTIPKNTMHPTVSVVMAAKNYARFLPIAVESIQAQTFTDWELVIVDDGSSDDTQAVVRPFLSDSRISYIRSDRLGQSRAKNLGIQLSRGELIAFLDADDEWLPTKLEKQVGLFQNRAHVGVVFSRRSLIDESGRSLPQKSHQMPVEGHVLSEMFVQNFICFSSVIVRRRVFEHMGGFVPEWDLAIDYDQWLRVTKHYEVDYVDEELVRYRTGHGNLSKKISDRISTVLSIMNRARTRYRVEEQVSPEVIAKGYASTYQTIGYIMRRSEPLRSAAYYLKSLAWPHSRIISVKGIVAACLVFLRRNRIPAEPANANCNV